MELISNYVPKVDTYLPNITVHQSDSDAVNLNLDQQSVGSESICFSRPGSGPSQSEPGSATLIFGMVNNMDILGPGGLNLNPQSTDYTGSTVQTLVMEQQLRIDIHFYTPNLDYE